MRLLPAAWGHRHRLLHRAVFGAPNNSVHEQHLIELHFLTVYHSGVDLEEIQAKEEESLLESDEHQSSKDQDNASTKHQQEY